MRRQRSVLFILLVSSAVLAALANLLGNLAADYVPLVLKANAPQLFALAILVEFAVGVALERLQQATRRLMRQVLAYLLIAVGAGSAALSGVASNLVATVLPQGVRLTVVPNVWFLLVAVTLLTILVEVVAYSLSRVSRLTPDNRTAFLSKVRERYTNRLRDTLGEAARIDLHLREDARALTQPALFRQVLSEGPADSLGPVASAGSVGPEVQREARELPAGTPISTVYDEAQEELLLLGEPGSGKTTLLVELAVELVGRAEKSKQLKLPVIFSLASWAVKRQALAEWMAEELHETYQVPPKVAAAWMEAEQILPLLDGLDEVAEEHRDACARQIDAYHREHELVPLVVCSRRREYFALPTRLHVGTALRIQPLTAEQIEHYLAQGEGLAGLRDALAADRRLCSAARTPLMLGVMALTYQGMADEAIPRIGNRVAWRRRLFDAYVPRMYHRQRGTSELEGRHESQTGWKRGRQPHGSRGRARPPAYTLEQTVQYLAWLAAQMRGHGQPEFYMERMQWDWLPDEGARLHSRIRLVGGLRWSWPALVGGLRVGLGVGLGVVLVAGLAFVLVAGLRVGLRVGLVDGLGVGLAVGLFFGLKEQDVDERDLRRPGEGIRRSLISGLVFVLAFVLVGVLVGGLAAGLVGGLVFVLAFMLVGVLVGGLVGVLVGGLGIEAYSDYRKLQRQLEQVGVVPRDYVRFLDFAAEHVLLQRIGGGYRFIHALLLDYFADRWVESGGTVPKAVLAEQVSRQVSLS